MSGKLQRVVDFFTLRGRVKYRLKFLIPFIILILVVSSFRIVGVDGKSMEPTYPRSSLVLICNLPFLPIKKGSVVVFKDWEDVGVYVIKRVTHLPGETIYEDTPPLILEPDEYWVEGDNRAISKDSRFLGPIKRKDIIGLVVN